MEELISVIVPVYKVEKYLRRCMDSIINQTYKNLEIILVDDGSPDECPQICDEYAQKDNRIKVIHKKNGGASAARNVALDIITGRYVTFVDSDDFIAKEAIENWKKILDNYKADIVVGNFCEYHDGQDVEQSYTGKQEFYTSEEMMRKMLVEKFEICAPWGKLYLVSLFNNIRYPENLKIAEDMAVIHKLFLQTERIVYDENSYYYYNQEGVSLVRSAFDLEKLKRIDVAKEWLDCVNQNYPNIYNEAFATYMRILINECTYLLNNKEWLTYLEKYIMVIRENYIEIKKSTFLNFKDKLKAFFLKNHLLGVYKLIRKTFIRG